MREGWEILDFEKCLLKVPSTAKIPKKKFLTEGAFPIVSQEEEYINGYWHNEDDVFKVEKPVVLFGDHTKIVKLVDFDFVKGADGIKVFLPKEDINSKFFAYKLQSLELKDLGYARHYRLLKKKKISIPPLPEQKQIVAILDKVFAAIDQAQANIEKNIENAKELFDNKKAEYFERLTLENELKPITETCEKIFAGGDKPKPNFSKTETDEFKIPVISNGEKNGGLFGYTDVAKVLKPAITVSARGTIGYISYRDYPFVPIVRLIVLIPKTEIIDIEFLMYAIKNLDILRTGSSIPQLTVPMIKGYSIPVPSKEEQKEIVECLNQLEIVLEDYKATLEKKILELEDLKKSILQKAFSGELSSRDVIRKELKPEILE